MSRRSLGSEQPSMQVAAPGGRTRILRRLATHPAAALALVAGLAASIYSNTLSASFHLDDIPTIVRNGEIRQVTNFVDLSGSRPVGFLTFALNYQVGELNVVGYHVVNLLIHIANGWLVYVLVLMLWRLQGTEDDQSFRSSTESRVAAIMAALLFVSHPIQTQAVTYIVQRFASLVALFYMLAVACYLRWRLATPGTSTRYLWYVGALAATILAMKTKETSFTLPFMLVLAEGVFFRTVSLKQWVPLIPFLLTLPIIPLSLSGGVGEAEPGFTGIDRMSYLFTQFRVLLTYLRLLALPIHQNVDYDYPIHHSFLDPAVFLSFLVLLALGGAAIWLLFWRPRYRLAAFGVLWFFLTIAVESSIIPIRDVIFEHRLYLPMVGLLFAGAVLVMGLRDRLRATGIVAVAIITAVFAVAAYDRNRVWNDEITLWSNVVQESPKKARGHNGLGVAYAYAGRLEEAMASYKTAIVLQPDFPKVHSNLGNIYLRLGLTEEAIAEYQTEIRFHPDTPEAHSNLGNAYVRQKRLDEAIREHETAVRLQPDFADLHHNLGVAYQRKGLYDKARREFETTLRLNPGFTRARQALEALERESQSSNSTSQTGEVFPK